MHQNKVNFIERNSLLPITALTDSPLKPAGLHLEACINHINDSGLKAGDFYYDPADPGSPYYYYSGALLLGFDSLEGRIESCKILINRMEREIKDSLARRDFDHFLGLIDPRIAPEVFMEAFNFIPDHEKFRLFERLWRFNPDAHDIFPPEFAQQAYQYRGVTSERPPADKDGFVCIYYGQDGDLLPEQAVRWTIDINRAIIKAMGFEPVAAIFQGRVHTDNIIAYDYRRTVKEVQVQAGSPLRITKRDFIDLRQFDDLASAGIPERFHYYTGQIERGWFHNPEGIHAIGHTRRVLMLSLLLAYLERYSQADAHLLSLAAVFHDIGRENDGYDPGHGLASYTRIVKENLLALDDHQDRETLRFIVENHAIPDRCAYQKLDRYNLGDVERTLRLYDAFKDADGLDRVRLGDLNPDYLRTASAQRLLLAAHQLYFEHQFD